MYLPNPSTTSRMRHKINFKRNMVGLNPEFSFSKIGYLTKTKERSLFYNYLPITGVRRDRFLPFPNESRCNEKNQSYPGFEFGSLIPFLMPSAPVGVAWLLCLMSYQPLWVI